MKVKNLLAILLTFIISFGVLNLAFAEETADIPEGYTPIYTAEDLNNIRNNLSGKYILMNDIDLSSYENWEPIGTVIEPFTGELNGNNLSIKNLSLKIDIASEETNTVALFGSVRNATISKLKLINLNININYPYNSTFFVGGVVAYCFESKINSCEVNGNISVISGGSIFAGGVVGYVACENKSEEIKNCVSSVDMQIIGENNSIWDLEITEYTYVGGIVGYAVSVKNINKCINEGNINVNSINIGMVGSIVGNSEDTIISKCKNTGSITALGTCVINETPLSITLWSRILLFFNSFWNYFLELFK